MDPSIWPHHFHPVDNTNSGSGTSRSVAPTQKQHCCWWLSRAAAVATRTKQEQQSSHLISCSSIKRTHLGGFPGAANRHAFVGAAGNIYGYCPRHPRFLSCSHLHTQNTQMTGAAGEPEATARNQRTRQSLNAPWGSVRLLPCVILLSTVRVIHMLNNEFEKHTRDAACSQKAMQTKSFFSRKNTWKKHLF